MSGSAPGCPLPTVVGKVSQGTGSWNLAGSIAIGRTVTSIERTPRSSGNAPCTRSVRVDVSGASSTSHVTGVRPPVGTTSIGATPGRVRNWNRTLVARPVVSPVRENDPVSEFRPVSRSLVVTPSGVVTVIRTGRSVRASAPGPVMVPTTSKAISDGSYTTSGFAPSTKPVKVCRASGAKKVKPGRMMKASACNSTRTTP